MYLIDNDNTQNEYTISFDGTLGTSNDVPNW